MTSITQKYLNSCAEGLEFNFVTIVDIKAKEPIRIADKNIYVDGKFYENRIKTPKVVRSIGEFLSPSVRFSSLKLDVSNVDGAFNAYLPGGINFPQLSKAFVTVSLGVEGLESSFFPIFEGKVEPIGGVRRDAKKITLSIKDSFESLNVEIPEKTFTKHAYPQMDENELGKRVPIVLGSWDGDKPELKAAVCNQLELIDNNGEVREEQNVKCVVSLNPLLAIDAVYLQKGDDLHLISLEDVRPSPDRNAFEIKQNGSTTLSLEDEDKPYTYSKSDKFLVKIRENTTNIVDQAKFLIETFCPDKLLYDSQSWEYARAKLNYISSRVAIDKPKKIINYVLSLLEQGRCELFVSKELKLKLSCLHLDALPLPKHTLTNWDIEKDTLKIGSDDKTSFNVSQGFYAYAPAANGNTLSTSLYQNKLSVEQIGEVSKAVEMPNLYQGAEHELVEILKISSSFREEITLNASLRSLLLDVGDMVYLRVKIGAIEYKDTVCQVREIGLDKDYRLPIKLLSFQMCPYKGYQPNYPGTAGGITASIEVKDG